MVLVAWKKFIKHREKLNFRYHFLYIPTTCTCYQEAKEKLDSGHCGGLTLRDSVSCLVKASGNKTMPRSASKHRRPPTSQPENPIMQILRRANNYTIAPPR